MKRATVAITRCSDYTPANVRRAVREAVALIPQAEELLGRRGRVLLKPNLLSSRDTPESAVNTHPEFVRAVAEFFTERGWEVLIGDSCGSMSAGSTASAIRNTGLDKVAADVGARILNFDREKTIELPVPGHRILATVRIPRIVTEVDLFVTLPKFKSHGLTLLTGALKNQIGLVPGKGKKEIHLAAPKPSAMAQAILDVFSVARPHLAIMDGIVGMEGNGPAAGPVREIGLVLAGADCVAVDAVMAAIMGYVPGDVPTVRFAQERGFGVVDLKEIEVRGVPLAEAVIPGFRRMPLRLRGALFAVVPKSAVRWMIKVAGTTYATVLDDRCVLCSECVTNCPANAFRKVKGKLRVDPKRCISCYCCSEVCEQRAIKMQRPLAGRVAYAIARMGTRKRPHEGHGDSTQ